jgi:hypothetical protein
VTSGLSGWLMIHSSTRITGFFFSVAIPEKG